MIPDTNKAVFPDTPRYSLRPIVVSQDRTSNFCFVYRVGHTYILFHRPNVHLREIFIPRTGPDNLKIVTFAGLLCKLHKVFSFCPWVRSMLVS